MSRLYRKLEELIDLILLARSTRLRKIWTTNNRGFDFATDEGIRNAVNAVYEAAEESRHISERTRRAKRNLAQVGKYNGGRRAYGYEGPILDAYGNVTNKHRIGIAIIEEEAEVIRQIVEKLLAGQSVRSIVRELNVAKIPSAEGNLWNRTSLTRMVQSPRLKGVRIYKGQEYPAIWEPILAEDIWERVHTLLTAKERHTHAAKKGARTYLLTGLVFCGICGQPMIGSASTKFRGAPPHRQYVCRKENGTGIQTGCGSMSRASDPVDALVTEALLRRLDTENLSELLARTQNGISAEEWAGLVQERDTQKAQLTEVAAAYAKRLLRIEQLATATQIIEEALEATERKMQRIEQSHVLGSLPADTPLPQEWEKRDLDWRRSLLRLVIKRVLIHPQGRTTQRYRQWTIDKTKIEIEWKA